MDLQEFWQDSKRWVLGVLAGLIVYWIGSGIVHAAFGGKAAVERVQATARSLSKEELYGADALAASRKENEALKAEEARVREHAVFVPDDAFVLNGKGDPDLYFPEVERRVRNDVLVRAQEQSVDMSERGLSWPAPVDREDKEATLLDLCVLRHAAMRLLEAGSEVRQRAPDALGLQSIDVLKIEARASVGSVRRPRSAAAGDLAERIDEHKVAFAFRADVATLQRWLEKLRTDRPSIGLAPDLRVTPGDQVGDPILVQGHLSAISIRELAQDG